jgi:transcriptional regulator with XRE-family HTH domain
MSSHPVLPVLSEGAGAAAERPEPELPSARRALTAVPDRATREAAAATARLAYCAQLKDVRERRGLTLAAIAERTKVNAGLYAALERADVSRWPTGIYRRSFFREYALALGLPLDSAVSEFLRLFPDDGNRRTPSLLASPAGPLRLTLAGPTWLRISRQQVFASLADLGAVAAITAGIAWWMPTGIGTSAALVTAIYYSLATAGLGCSPGTWWLRTRGNRTRAKALRLAR